MKTIINIRLLFILFLTSPIISFSQIYNSEDEQVIHETITFYEGKVTMNDNTEINGLVSINHRRNKKFVTIVKSDGRTTYIPNHEIVAVTMISKINNTTLENTFEKIEMNGKLYRIVGIGKRKIYDESTKPSTNLVGELFVKEQLNTHSLYNFWSSGPKQDLINYINKRDNKLFTKKDFKTKEELIEYAIN